MIALKKVKAFEFFYYFVCEHSWPVRGKFFLFFNLGCGHALIKTKKEPSWSCACCANNYLGLLQFWPQSVWFSNVFACFKTFLRTKYDRDYSHNTFY